MGYEVSFAVTVCCCRRSCGCWLRWSVLEQHALAEAGLPEETLGTMVSNLRLNKEGFRLATVVFIVPESASKGVPPEMVLASPFSWVSMT
jgi:predicted metal-binding transcription factor (methanogenesis marker protein 9)